jgi:TolB protein
VTTIRNIKLLLLIGSFTVLISCEEYDFYYFGSDYKILFISRRIENSADWKMYIMNSDGTNQHAVVNMTVQYGSPGISHDNKKVAFIHVTEDYKEQLYIADTSGTGIQMIDSSNFFSSLDWSLDDSKLIYSKLSGTNGYAIYEYTFLNNTNQLLIINGSGHAEFSPDAKTITYLQDGNINLMDLDGSDKRKLISDAGSFQWSPEGDKIAFATTGVQGSPQISIANADGTSQKQLTSSYWPSWDSGFPAGFGNYDPRWTPDESKIVYVSSLKDGTPTICIMNSDGSDQTMLTYSLNRNEDPVFTPDGRFILFDSNRDPKLNSDIYIMDTSGNYQTPLSKYQNDDCCPIIIQK